MKHLRIEPGDIIKACGWAELRVVNPKTQFGTVELENLSGTISVGLHPSRITRVISTKEERA
jgi:hypothetical protein